MLELGRIFGEKDEETFAIVDDCDTARRDGDGDFLKCSAKGENYILLGLIHPRVCID